MSCLINYHCTLVNKESEFRIVQDCVGSNGLDNMCVHLFISFSVSVVSFWFISISLNSAFSD